MDTQELLMKGGKNGVIIKANDVANSELIKRLLLPEEDEHHMPPKGKTPLTEQEIFAFTLVDSKWSGFLIKK